jgi:hypothetical protein
MTHRLKGERSQAARLAFSERSLAMPTCDGSIAAAGLLKLECLQSSKLKCRTFQLTYVHSKGCMGMHRDVCKASPSSRIAAVADHDWAMGGVDPCFC